MTFEVWVEGYAATGERGAAQFLGTQPAWQNPGASESEGLLMSTGALIREGRLRISRPGEWPRILTEEVGKEYSPPAAQRRNGNYVDHYLLVKEHATGVAEAEWVGFEWLSPNAVK